MAASPFLALAGRPLLLAAFTGGLLSWPLGEAEPWQRVVLALCAALVAVADLRCATWARVATTVGVLVTTAAAMLQRLDEPAFGLAALMAATWSLLHAWARRTPAEVPAHASGTSPAAAVLVAMTVVSLAWSLPVPLLPVLLGLGLLGLGVLRHHPEGDATDSLADQLLDSPARIMVFGFAALCAAGALVLVLPIASTAPGSIRLVDALFTSVSATCVTGLAVLDTPGDFTFFGQAAILALIQLGGLGIMTFAALVAVTMGRRLGVREEAMTADLMGGGHARRDLESALRTVFRVTAWTESLGAVALTPLFVVHGDDLPTAAWRALFTSISAFCNAGFALQSDSLMGYQHDAGVLLVVSALIVVGGLGPLVIVALPMLRKGRGNLHTRLAVVTTVGLLVVPTLLFLALEWDGTLAALSPRDKVINAWFQSVTLRTAGFNSIDFGAIQPATWTLSLVCMFVGGSPGSTAGGVKTTTVAVLLLSVVAAIRRHDEAAAYGRRIPHRNVYEATAITAMGVLCAVGALLALQVTQAIPIDLALFEVVSALGTAGLSMGATGMLDDVGKVLISGCMFAGRVGPLTLFIFLVGRARARHRYPLEAVQVG